MCSKTALLSVSAYLTHGLTTSRSKCFWWLAALTRWSPLTASMPCRCSAHLLGASDDVMEIQNLLHNFNIPFHLFTILQTNIDVLPPNGPGALKRAKSEGLKCLVVSEGMMCLLSTVEQG